MPDPEIAIVTDDPGWHGRELARALAARGLSSAFVSLSECRLELEEDSVRVAVPGFAALPRALFSRGIPGGTLEQVILRLDFLHRMEALGIPVYNNTRAIERTVDKAMTSLLLTAGGVPGPRTWVCESEAQARDCLSAAIARGEALVLKPLFGSQGQGLRLLRQQADLPGPAAVRGVYYLQRYLPPRKEVHEDLRVLVIGGRAVAAMRRRSDHWITNRAQGARCEPLPLREELCRLAVRACELTGVEYGGVDLMRDRDGRLLVTEVNSMPAWRGLQQATGIEIAPLLVEDFLDRIGTSPLRAVAGCAR